MEPQNQHIIRSCVMDLHLAERRESSEIQERVSRICHEQVIPALSRLCDELSPEQGRMIVDKLEIDIGVIDKRALDHELADRMLARFREEVKKLKLASLFGLDLSLQPSVEHTGPGEESRNRVDLLIHFFRHGTVPWWNPYPNRDLSQWIREQFAEDKQLLVAAVGAELGTPAFRSRVVRLFSDRHFKSLFRHYGLQDVFQFYEAIKGEIHQKSSRQHKALTWRYLRNPLLEMLLEQLWAYSAIRSFGSEPGGAPTQIVTSQQKKIAVANTIHSLEEAHGVSEKIINHAIHSLSQAQALFSQEEWKSKYSQTDILSNLNEQNKKLPANSSEEAKPDSAPKAGREPFIEVQNAGLVLLWINLSRLFTTLGYVKEQAFVNEQAIHRAVHLLHYVSTGQNFGDEHEWTLNKLLCGLPPESFVRYEIDLADREKAEAEAMVKAAVDNWRALKNTSVEGFRDAFLKRNGILTSDINGWKLQVERLSYDILLEKLPWPISAIKLPWNDYLIHVQW